MNEKCTYDIWSEDGRLRRVDSKNYLPLTLMQKIVGGFIEIHKLGKTWFVIDEEGKVKGKKPNIAFPAFVGTVITTQNGIEKTS